jgi:hypothetical protein
MVVSLPHQPVSPMLKHAIFPKDVEALVREAVFGAAVSM